MLRVSVLLSGSSGPDSAEPWSGTLSRAPGQDALLTDTVSLSTQVYKWSLANLMLGVRGNHVMDKYPIQGERKITPSRSILRTETGISHDLMGQLARTQTSPFLYLDLLLLIYYFFIIRFFYLSISSY